MNIRATHAESWGNQSVLAACKQQLCDLDALDALHPQLIRQSSKTPCDMMLSINIAKYFISFWPEHIPNLGRINEQEAHAWAWGLVLGTWS